MNGRGAQILPLRGRWPGGPEGVPAAESADETPSVAEFILGPALGRTRGRQLPQKGSIWL